MTVFRGFSIVIVSALGFAAAGATIGGLIGRFVPDYYRLVFRLAQNGEPDLTLIGLVLGGTQGLLAGIVVGLVIVVAVTLYRSRAERLASEERQSLEDPMRR